MGHNTTFVTTLAAATIALMMVPSASFAVEATEIGPGQSGPGTPPGLAGKGEGPWAKAGSTLRRVFAAHGAHQQAAGDAPFKPGIPSIRFANGLILIDAVAANGDGAALLSDLQAFGLKDGTAFGSVVSGFIPLGRLDKVVELGSLRAISASLKPETNSAVDPTFGLVHDRRGAIAMNLIQDKVNPEIEDAGYTGVGIKVGVLSDTFNNNGGSPATDAADDLLNGDLPGGGGTGAFVALHTPGDVDDDDRSSFAAMGTSGSNTAAGDALQSVLPASIRFNPASFNEDPVTAVVSYPDAPHYTIGTKPFTIESWVRFESLFPTGQGPVVASQYSSSSQRAWILYVSGPNDANPSSLSLFASPDGASANAVAVNWPWVPSIGTWYHVAVARDENNDVRAFVDGQQIGTPQQLSMSIFDSTEVLRLGTYNSSPNNNRPLDGWLEDFRFTVGEALYTTNFLPPTQPLPSELPPPPGQTATTTVLLDGEGGIDEGRAMMQLIHDVAPDASLSFHTAFIGLADFAQGILDLAADGADVIVDDIIYFAEPMFQDGIIAQAVDTVALQGVAYFSSAGNAAQHSYESPFVSSGEPFSVGGEDRGTLHDFNAGNGPPDYMQSVTIPVGATFTMVAQWDQPFASNCPDLQPPQVCPGSTNDVDIYLVKDSGSGLQIVASSISDNLTSGEPVEILQFGNPGGPFGTEFQIMIAHYDVVTDLHPQPGSPPTLMKYVWFGQSTITINEHTTDSPTSYGHANAAGAAAVGAAFYLETPAFGFPIPEIEGYSSKGGVPILFDKMGNPIVAEYREKPEFVAPDGTNTTFFYLDTTDPDENTDEFPETFPNFFGTSAAAPHAAAIAALMLEANPSLLPADIYSILESTAIDMGDQNTLDPFDFDTGYGLIDASAALEVTGGNLMPVAVIDSVATDQNTMVSIPVLANDALGNQPTTITLPSSTSAEGGTVTVNDRGTPDDPLDDKVDYTPGLNDVGPDSFNYMITDNDGDTSIATVNVTVNEVDVPPNAVDDAASTNEGVPTDIYVLVNDDQGNAPATITAAGPGAVGSIVTHTDSTVTYVPPPDSSYIDYIDIFPYTITDSDGDVDTANITITIQPVNDPPSFNEDNFVKLNAVVGEPYSGQTLSNDASDPEGDSLFFAKLAGLGWLIVAPNGDLSGTPSPGDVGFNGYLVGVSDTGGPPFPDTATANLFITVDAQAGNNAPVAGNDAYSTDENVALNVAAPGVLNGDTDGDSDPLTAVLNTTTSNGALTLNADGSFNYTPTANFSGTDSFTYHANDGIADSNIATVTITVNLINVAPVAGNDAYSTDENVALNVTAPGVLNGDTDGDSDPLTSVLNTTTSNGALTLNADGSFNYTPTANFSGTDSFTYHANDGIADSNIATVTITVNPAAPVVHIGAISASSAPAPRGRWNATVTFTIHLADHGEVSGALVEGIWSNGTKGGTSCTTVAGGQCAVSKANLKDNVASVDFTVTNVTLASGTYNFGANDTSNAITVLQTGNPVNLMPNAVNDSATTTMNVTVNGNVLTNDDQGDAPATVTSTDMTGTLGTLSGATVATNGAFSYTPPSDLTAVDSFGYTITDNNGDTSSATVTITINPDTGNVTPVANADPNYSTTENVTLIVSAPGILGNDTDGDSDPLTAVFNTTTSNGALTLNADGGFSYIPDTDFIGSDSFTYFAYDGTVNSSAPATVTITIDPAPGAISLSATGYKVKGVQHADLTWSGATSAVDIYRDDNLIGEDISGSGYIDNIRNKGGGNYVYEVCEANSATVCSNTANVVF